MRPSTSRRNAAPPATLDQAVGRLVALKQEHRPLLAKIVGDPGMSPETRRALVDHLCAEEDEHVSAIAALAAARGPRDVAAPRGLTVGALRPQEQSTSVGSLRRTTAPAGPGRPAADRS